LAGTHIQLVHFSLLQRAGLGNKLSAEKMKQAQLINPDKRFERENMLAQSKTNFHPLIVLASSLVAASLYALYALQSPHTRANISDPAGSFWYVVPIVVPFVAFLFDRFERLRQLNPSHFVIDLIVVGAAVGRVVAHVPLVSGHTLFLTYAIISSRSRVVKIATAIVMAHAVYLKYFIWHDLVTSTTGILLGAVAGFLVFRFGQEAEPSDNGISNQA